ncbi:SIR2-like domain-containing protein [Desulfatibacillum alkenivorans DSM 16219]|uniref:SIR2-like domain-containing protein n=1 Tax=Desulfatibacillum alkenivorans DSM 16219 TaxID=1121393 RepID=A0A1M6ZYQ8_9BACT|nr:SIR2 family protein [Desulfatibacillum alkenivorans]SHL35509.1 SIR2-like domain-containing protein [Desulfatibacillum alkenivorans DSM 16219]
MTWPLALIEELAERRCIIFIGSGISASCKAKDDQSRNPPTWKDLLEKMSACIKSEDDQRYAQGLIEKGQFLDAAEIINHCITPADFSTVVQAEFLSPNFEHSVLHEYIMDIDPKILITTNYDKIYDSYCLQGEKSTSYVVCKYTETNIIDCLRSKRRMVIKAHGCIDHPAKMVLTKSQYFEARRRYGNFYNILDALFLTNTLLFLGYSLLDPDIQLILESSNIAAESAHTHYALVPDGQHAAIKNAIAKSYNITFIEYKADNYQKVEELLLELSKEVEAYRASFMS